MREAKRPAMEDAGPSSSKVARFYTLVSKSTWHTGGKSIRDKKRLERERTQRPSARAGNDVHVGHRIGAPS